jgi:hypothetical protein
MAEPMLGEQKRPSEALEEEQPRWKMLAISVLVVLALFFVCGGVSLSHWTYVR